MLEEELAVSPMKGKPLEQRLRNFRPGADSAIRALGGPTLWMRRLRTIEDEVERHEAELGERWLELAEEATRCGGIRARVARDARAAGASRR